MARKLPPLNAVKAFEAAARHLSITRAAEELHVTQAAVSHQIKSLEEHLGVALFRRQGRGLALTMEGRAYATPVAEGLDRIDHGGRVLRRMQRNNRLVVSALPSFAAAWLVPRIGRFLRRYPEIDVHIAPSQALVDFERDEVDLGLRYGLGNYPGLVTKLLMDEDVFPVCSPALAAQAPGLDRPENLCHYTLLHDDGHGEWRAWLKHAAVEGVDAGSGPVFTDSGMVIQSAVEGHGVALARGSLAREALIRGKLIRPFKKSLPSRFAYYVVYPQVASQRREVQVFEAWLMEEVSRDEQSG